MDMDMNYLWNIMKQSLEVLDMINGYGYELCIMHLRSDWWVNFPLHSRSILFFKYINVFYINTHECSSNMNVLCAI